MRWMAILIVVGACWTSRSAIAAATREELAIRYSGPVTISPWRAAEDAKQQASSSQRQLDRYSLTLPAPFYYCGWGYGYGCGYFGYHYANGWYGLYRPYFYHYPDGRYLP